MDDKDILLLLVGAVISLIINYITQYTSNPLANKFNQWRNKLSQEKAKRSIEKARKRISDLDNELRVLKWFSNNPVAFSAFAAARLQNLILRVGLLVTTGVLTIIFVDFSNFWSLTLLLLFIVLSATVTREDKMLGVKNIFTRVYNWHSNEEEIKKRIAELQEFLDHLEQQGE